MEVTATPCAAQLPAMRATVRRIRGAGQAGSMNSWVSCMRPMPTSPASTPTRSSGSAKRLTNGFVLNDSVKPIPVFPPRRHRSPGRHR